ncbi:hypothetical protein ABNF97_20565 [Plantactinospora sp. B6F1]|uniref:restriction system modified-DNA reader domain-containing protein n=1 Tax=Plantactinospora sp. B6F1 TaxID=3158971 RepID=UPI0032D95991
MDDEVYALLQQHAQPFVDRENDVLRRLLGLDGEQPPRTAGAPRRRTGDLMPFINAELLRPGDELVHVQPRRGLEHRATVTSDGHLELADGRVFGKPSPALKACVGHDINGWDQWTHTPSGHRLKDLREELRRR